MIKKIIQSIRMGKKRKETPSIRMDRHLLEEKVKKGTDMAIREYRDVFIKLADYYRT